MKRFKLQIASVVLVVLALFIVGGQGALGHFGFYVWSQAAILALPGIILIIAVGVSRLKHRRKAEQPPLQKSAKAVE